LITVSWKAMPCSHVRRRFGESASSIFRVLTDDGRNHRSQVLIIILYLATSTAVLWELQHTTSLIPGKGKQLVPSLRFFFPYFVILQRFISYWYYTASSYIRISLLCIKKTGRMEILQLPIVKLLFFCLPRGNHVEGEKK
jgi:hypothetical protein